MRTTTTRRRTALTAGALTMALAGQAHAAGWTPPQLLPDTFDAPSIGFDGSGTATAGNIELTSPSPIATRLEFLVRGQDGAWNQQFARDSAPGFVPAQTNVAVAKDGSAAACVVTYDSTDLSKAKVQSMATYRPAGSSTWEPLAPITGLRPASTFALPCQAEITPTGTAAVLAARVDTPGDFNTEDDSLVLSVHTPGGSWSAAQQLNVTGQSSMWGELGLDDDGNATVAWDNRYQKVPQARRSIRVRTRTASNGVLGAPLLLTPEQAPANAGSPMIGVNGAGQAAVGFQDSASELQVATRASAAAASWTVDPIFTAGTTASSGPRDVGVSPSGTAYVLYWKNGKSSVNDDGGLVRHPLGGVWSAPQPTSPENTTLHTGALTFLGDDAFAALDGSIGQGGGNPGTSIVQAGRWAASAPTPDAATDLLDQDAGFGLSDLRADNIGDAVALVSDDRNVASRGYSLIAYDATPPVLTGSLVPDHAVVGTAVQLKAQFTDAYSAIGSVRWDFGDGTDRANGPTVTHAWAAPGSYEVLATGVDAIGNAVTSHFTVHVDALQSDHAAPTISIALPACKKHASRQACKAARARAATWKKLTGAYADDAPGGHVTITATRAKGRGHKAKTITVGATLTPKGWSTKLKGLGSGKWTFTATATDSAGNANAAKVTRTLR